MPTNQSEKKRPNPFQQNLQRILDDRDIKKITKKQYAAITNPDHPRNSKFNLKQNQWAYYNSGDQCHTYLLIADRHLSELIKGTTPSLYKRFTYYGISKILKISKQKKMPNPLRHSIYGPTFASTEKVSIEKIKQEIRSWIKPLSKNLIKKNNASIKVMKTSFKDKLKTFLENGIRELTANEFNAIQNDQSEFTESFALNKAQFAYYKRSDEYHIYLLLLKKNISSLVNSICNPNFLNQKKALYQKFKWYGISKVRKKKPPKPDHHDPLLHSIEGPKLKVGVGLSASELEMKINAWLENLVRKKELSNKKNKSKKHPHKGKKRKAKKIKRGSPKGKSLKNKHPESKKAKVTRRDEFTLATSLNSDMYRIPPNEKNQSVELQHPSSNIMFSKDECSWLEEIELPELGNIDSGSFGKPSSNSTSLSSKFCLLSKTNPEKNNSESDSERIEFSIG